MSYLYEMIVCVVNSGFSDNVMSAAREYGAKGGTVLTARGTANQEAETFFGISIQPEKEVVLILVPAKIKDDIRSAELTPADRILLEKELERKQGDRFSDKSSLFEYSNLLTVLGRGYVEQSDFASFALLFDDALSAFPEEKIRERLDY